MLKSMTVVGLICIAAPLAAAESGQWGLVGEPWGPTQLGALWHLGDKYALRPAVGGLLGASTRSLSGDDCVLEGRCRDRDQDWASVAAGVDLLRYFSSRDGFAPYLALGANFQYRSTNTNGTETDSQRQWAPRLVVGLQYSFGTRIAIYGEAGMESSWYRTKRSTSGVRDVSNGRSTNSFASGAGVILYLN